MKFSMAVLCCVAVFHGATAATTGSPVDKVVELLKDLQAKALADGEVEQKIYAKYACWCEKTTKSKAEAIVAAKNELRALGQQILKLKGLTATREAEVKELADQIEANQKGQDDATAVRTKENSDYMAKSAETMQALASLEQAVKVLSDATLLQSGKAPAALLQSATRAELQAKAAAGVRNMIDMLPNTYQMGLGQDSMSMLSEFARNGARAEYSPQSDSIQGILKDMYDTMSATLEDDTQTEASKNRVFEDFMNEKQTEMVEMKDVKAKKESEKAEAESELAETTQAYDDTQDQMSADIKFFDTTKEACSAKGAEWTERKAMRAEEIAGMKEAVKILNSDDARALFDKAIKKPTSFLQVSTTASSAAASSAYMALKTAASRSRSTRVAHLAVMARTAKAGHFGKVIEAIGEVETTLKKEEQKDIDDRDHCKEEYMGIEKDTKDIKWQIKTDIAHINKIKARIEAEANDKTKTLEELAEVVKNMAQMEDERTAENEAFVNAKSDDEAAIVILTKAKEALSKFYKKNTLLLQKQPVFGASEDQAPDATFSDKGSRKNQSKGIVGLMEMFIEDLTLEVKNGIKNEAKAQADFEAAMADANKLRDELIQKKNTLEAAIAAEKDDKSSEFQEELHDEEDLDAEVKHKVQIQPDCDWMLGAFYERQKARAKEMQGLVEAKEFLSGASASSSSALQLSAGKPFDDTAFGRTGFLGLH
eukprot:gnl/TRDRNA2_/TRDRNA2_176029_c2_seq19.p1 gnl/TRDRNA2_/TRDRNA2_176029_c2~~gnl/TRDRNA2_/TRDRNA2_176029_c2_seq19.p1  ORF type:complete len:711 (-),score=234.78 gnl/TRDRNA2_/TRDRNA2_176029_c2_seq19:90-2222(-)